VTDNPAPEYPQAVNGSQETPSVNSGGTGECASAQIKRARKREPAEQGKMLYRMVTAAARRAAREDPSQGLAMMLQVEKLIHAKVEEVGRQAVATYGASDVARDLNFSDLDITDGRGGHWWNRLLGRQVWSKQNVHKRWGPKS
jgi:hypothetical protein